jgi:hypothetical protein
MSTIILRNRTFEIQPNETAMLPLRLLLNYGIGTANEPDWAAVSDHILQQLAEPSVHYKIAFALKTLIRKIPSDWVDYQIIELKNGKREHKMTLTLTPVEILSIMAQLGQATQPNSHGVSNG